MVILIVINWVQWEFKVGEVKFCWDWSRKRSCGEKEIYRGFELNLIVEFVLNKYRRGRGGGGYFKQKKQGQFVKMQRRRGLNCEQLFLFGV